MPVVAAAGLTLQQKAMGALVVAATARTLHLALLKTAQPIPAAVVAVMREVLATAAQAALVSSSWPTPRRSPSQPTSALA